MRFWSDMYLRDRFGDLTVLIEVKHEDRTREPKRMTIREFLALYDKAEAYIVSVIPEPMADEVLAPPLAACTSYRHTLQETNVWLSSGDTVSLLHNDADNIVNCLLQGTKDWIFVDPRFKPRLYMNATAPGGDPDGGTGIQLQRSDWSEVNPSAVDTYAHPLAATVPWSGARIMAGDCVYLPPGFVHQVRSPPGRNLAVSFMFMNLWNISSFTVDEQCIADPQRAWPRFSDLPFPWKYSGYGRVPMGYMAPNEILTGLMVLLETFGEPVDQLVKRSGATSDGHDAVLRAIGVQSSDRGIRRDPFIRAFEQLGGGDAKQAALVWRILMQGRAQGGVLDARQLAQVRLGDLKSIGMLLDEPHGDDGREEYDPSVTEEDDEVRVSDDVQRFTPTRTRLRRQAPGDWELEEDDEDDNEEDEDEDDDSEWAEVSA